MQTTVMLARLGSLLALLGLLACKPAAVSEQPSLGSAVAIVPPEIERVPPPSCEGGGLTAIVDGVTIERAAFVAIYSLKLQKYADRGRDIPATADRRYQQSITDRLIYQKILELESERVGVSYDETELAEREAAQKRGIEDWDKHLRRRGESDASLRALYIAELREQALLEQRGMLAVSEEEVLAEYEKLKPDYVSDEQRVRASHILFRFDSSNKAEVLALAESVYQRAAAGEDFAALAREFSEGPSARKGGDLGVFARDRMVDEFSKVAFRLKPGDISKPFETKFGIHVVKVWGRYAPGELPLEALEDQIRERLGARKLHEGRRMLKAELLDAYAVDNCMRREAEARGDLWDSPRRSSESDD